VEANILLTGATGFIGNRLAVTLHAKPDVNLIAAVRSRVHIPVIYTCEFLMLGATLLGKKSVAQRLLGSLQVDISKARDLLAWESPISVEEGLRRCFVKD